MKTKNQKWIYIGLAMIAILGLAYWYFTKDGDKNLMDPSSEPIATGKPKPGEANSISDLLPDCQAKFEHWKKWMITSKPDWYKDLLEKAQKTNTPIDRQLANTWLWMYNEAKGKCWE